MPPACPGDGYARCYNTRAQQLLPRSPAAAPPPLENGEEEDSMYPPLAANVKLPRTSRGHRRHKPRLLALRKVTIKALIRFFAFSVCR
jgi:hypothetical protein